MDVYEIVRTGYDLIFKVRAVSEGEAEAFVSRLEGQVGTFMVDTTDWRFVEACDGIDRYRIVEIYAD